MMRDDYRTRILWFVLPLTIAAALILMVYRYAVRPPERTVTETVYVHDTTVIEKPVPFEIYIDTSSEVAVPVEDMKLKDDDSSLMVLPMQVKTFRGENYSLQIRGYQPELQWIELYHTETREVPKRNSVFISAGMTVSRQIQAPLFLGYRYTGKFAEMSLGAGYDFMQKVPAVEARLTVPIKRW